ncbi:MAG TPA: ubiquinone/menaquinone biosynthesis methyltransferase, partial [Tepidisphaeraceae bacterium]|nr:ubiquinone/menaquinone biosynthesis methyltransferase [Tepidisphaeraceae bacterium]
MPVTESAVAWDESLLANPHAVADKRSRVKAMFTAIAPSYDRNNRLHSIWMDEMWRRRAVKLARVEPSDVILDVACGTGDVSLKFFRALHKQTASPAGRVIGLDFTYAMLPLAREKAKYRGADITWINGDAQALPLPDSSVDVLSISFGIRNVVDTAAALAEFRRVLRPGGRLVILEFWWPPNPILKMLFNFYFRHLLPFTATLLSGDKTRAYYYLPISVSTYLTPDRMTD